MRATRVGSVSERFEKRYSKDAASGCWNWTGPLNRKGYGEIGGVVIDGVRYAERGRKMLAHRVSWLLFRGEIPANEAAHGSVVMHVCDNPSCVNPEHLLIGTQADNVKDMIQKGRKVAGAWQKAKGVEHFRSAFKNQADIDLICSTRRNTKALAERFGVDISTIKRIRRRNADAP